MPVPRNASAPHCFYYNAVRCLWKMSIATADALYERNPVEYKRRYTIAKILLVGFSSGRSLRNLLEHLRRMDVTVTPKERERITEALQRMMR